MEKTGGVIWVSQTVQIGKRIKIKKKRIKIKNLLGGTNV